MLKIKFGHNKLAMNDIKSEFLNSYEEEWFDDQFVKDMVLDVDKTEVLSPHCMQSPVLGQIPPERLSGGVLALILMYKTDYLVNASKCGDNCAKWILEIANKKDLTIVLEHIMHFGCDFDAELLGSGKITHTNRDYVFNGIDLLEKARNKMTE